MVFPSELMQHLNIGGALALELPALRPDHRRFVSIGWYKLAKGGTPEFAAEPRTYLAMVYEVHASRVHERVDNAELRDLVDIHTQDEVELARFAAKFAPLGAYKKHTEVQAPR